MKVRSRIGNIVMAVIGVLYAVAAAAVMVWYLVDTWRAIGRADILISVSLLAASFFGVLLLQSGVRNLMRRDAGTRVLHFFGAPAPR
ncbi:MAG TPA: hypothetical protein VGF69_25160 [Thermoanaerobaculia bacterium]